MASETEGMVRLWQSVIYTAIKDALTAINMTERRRADAWIRAATVRGNKHGAWFRQCCTLAGMDPDFVVDAYVSNRINARSLMQDGRGRYHRAGE